MVNVQNWPHLATKRFLASPSVAFDLGGDAVGLRHDPRRPWRGCQDGDLSEAIAATEVPGIPTARSS